MKEYSLGREFQSIHKYLKNKGNQLKHMNIHENDRKRGYFRDNEEESGK